MQKKLYVGNLSYQATEQELEELFSQYGKVQSVSLIRDKFSGQSKGFAFVEMSEPSEAEKALAQDGQSFQERTIRVSEARPPQQNFRGGGGGGGGGYRGGGGGGRDRDRRGGGGGGGWGRH